MRLGLVLRLVAGQHGGVQGGESGAVLVLGQDQRPGTQAMAGGVPGRAGLALGGDRAAGKCAVTASEIGLGGQPGRGVEGSGEHGRGSGHGGIRHSA